MEAHIILLNDNSLYLIFPFFLRLNGTTNLMRKEAKKDRIRLLKHIYCNSIKIWSAGKERDRPRR